MHPQGKRRARRTLYMSIFPTKVLLATDGSKEAELAARTAADLQQKTGSELHVVHVFGIAPVGPPFYPEAPDLQGEALEEEAEEQISEQRAREVLEVEVGKVRSAGGTLVEAHLIEGRPYSDGQQGPGRDTAGLDGQRLGRRDAARSLPRLSGARCVREARGGRLNDGSCLSRGLFFIHPSA
jgi:hypothetical protein